MTWPAPPPRRGSHVQHSWRCPRDGVIHQTVKRLPDGQPLTVDQCSSCQGDDAAYRLRHDPDPDAAA